MGEVSRLGQPWRDATANDQDNSIRWAMVCLSIRADIRSTWRMGFDSRRANIIQYRLANNKQKHASKLIDKLHKTTY
jgi:hypothetical protein